MPRDGSDPVGQVEAWDAAPCGLLTVDGDGIITAVNAQLLNRTGYAAEALVGVMHWTTLLAVGSRLFYETQLAPVLELDGALDEVMIDLRAADGSRMPALLNAARVVDPDSRRAGARIALMTVPDRRAYETELRQAREVAVQASAADARARLRLELLANANTALASSSDIEVALAGLARVLVEHLADWCVIYASDPAKPTVPGLRASAHRNPDVEPELRRLAEILPLYAQPDSALSQVLAGGQPVLLAEVGEARRHESTTSDEVRRLYDVVGLRSAMVAPCTTRATRVATVIAGRGPEQTPFNADDLSILADLGARCGIVIDNVRRHNLEHSNSLALQDALLTQPPLIAGLEVAIRYLPASEGNDVGGDWYDAFVQPDGTPVVVIGDVMGHDIRAAAAMGQLRAVLRTVGYTHAGAPAEILTSTDSTTQALGVNAFATTLVSTIELLPDGSGLLRSASAGHLPPILVTRDGPARIVDIPPGPPLGIRTKVQRHDHTEALAVGDTVLLYTDGLVEVRGASLAGRLEVLRATVEQHATAPPDALAELVLPLADGAADDVALLVL
ncbi:SpoIIE family protein phosphatase, partial [Jatrophihabitans sp.]|uniref:SpoIIE family protein phosphatase n=1 Tax=Jatrophihabitans sp. TaxID=1932789 RepID=UPI0030C69E22|nr:putative Serine phosphatase RsbU, regulator of sigma subunit [Jatrophihabitans sp.]